MAIRSIFHSGKKLWQNQAVRFLFLVLSFYIFWETLYYFFIERSALSYSICNMLGYTAASLLQLFNFEATWDPYIISINGIEKVYVDTPCNGLEFIGLLICFVVAYPTKIKAKLSFLILGTLLIHGLNTLRVFFLAINFHLYRSSFDFNHHVTFTVLIYGVILLLCLFWARKQFKNESTAQ